MKKRIEKIIIILILMFHLIFLNPGLQIFSQEKERDVTNIDLQLNLIAGYLSLDMTNEAMIILDQLMTYFPENYDLHLYRGIALCMNQDYKSAYEEFRKIDNALDLRKKGSTRPLSGHPASVLLQKEIFVFSPKNTGLLNFGRGVTLIAFKEDYKTAVSKLASAKKEGYDWINANYLLTYSYLKMRDYKKADQELRELLNRKEMDEKDYFLKGYLSYQMGMEREAVSFFEKALEIEPDFIEARKNLASIHYNKGEFEKAVEIWSRLHEDNESRLNIGRAYFRLGRYEEAKKQLESLNIPIPPERFTPKQISLSLITPDDWYRFNVGYMINYGEIIKKGVDTERLRRMGIKPSMLFAQLNEEALFALRVMGNIERAIEILTSATQIENTPFYVYYNLGMLHFNLRNLEEAKEYALLSLQRKDGFLDAHDLLGNVHFMEQNYEKAVEEFKKVIEISESDAQGHYNLGCAYWALNEWNKAEEEWKKAIKYDVKIERKETDEKLIQDELAISLIVRKISVAYRAHISLGSLYEKKAFIDNAIMEYEAAVKIEPDNPEAYFELGRMYFDKKLKKEATFYLKKHINLGCQNQEKAKKLKSFRRFF